MSINKRASKRVSEPSTRNDASRPVDSPESDIEGVLSGYRELITLGLRGAVGAVRARGEQPPGSAARRLEEFYGQIEYHLGWRSPDLSPADYNPGKLLRPTLVLIACDLAASRAGVTQESKRKDLLRRITPAAVTIELVHNFSLIHDDIEDGDEERRHRPTMWKLWGIPQAINSGDGLFALARTGLWQLASTGIPAAQVLHLAELLDQTCLELCEGQFLDMRYEGGHDISVDMYLDMIGRKTAALMSCATEFGACLGAPDDTDLQAHFARFGRALGIAFQLRDDLLGIWEAVRLGKTSAGDLRRKKMSLPVIHALETASVADRAALLRIMSGAGPTAEEDIGEALAILDRTRARARIREALAEQGNIARAALEEGALRHATLPANQAYGAFRSLLDFVLATQ